MKFIVFVELFINYMTIFFIGKINKYENKIDLYIFFNEADKDWTPHNIIKACNIGHWL